MSKAQFVDTRDLEKVLTLLTPVNERVCRVCLATGLRISDVLSLTVEQLRKKQFTIQEKKTGKRRVVRIPLALRSDVLAHAGTVFCFPHRYNGRLPRTRWAVYKDLKRADRVLSIGLNVTPHSMRKVYAVNEFQKDGDLSRVRKLLNHSSDAVTILYALADKYAKRKKKNSK